MTKQLILLTFISIMVGLLSGLNNLDQGLKSFLFFFKYKNENIVTLKPGLHTVYLPADHKSSQQIPIDVFIPPKSENCLKSILVLPGWNFSRERWHQETQITQIAEQEKYCLVFPEMGKAIYASQYFDVTTRKVFPIPSTIWIETILLPQMTKKYGILKETNANFLLGLSTGARGVAILALRNSIRFKAAAMLSGDFDQSKMPKDKLMAQVYGDFNNNEKRWKTIDNPQSMASNWQIAAYIGHGKNDKVVPVDQSIQFAEEISKTGQPVTTSFRPMGHDFQFWKSELVAIFKFFASRN